MNLKFLNRSLLCALLVAPYLQAANNAEKTNNKVRKEMLQVFDEFISPKNPEKKVKDYAEEMKNICTKGDTNFQNSHKDFLDKLKTLNSSSLYSLYRVYSALKNPATKKQIGAKIINDPTKRKQALEALQKRL